MQTTQKKREAAFAQHAAKAPTRKHALTTEAMLLQQYGAPLIALERIREDYFPEHGRLDHFLAAIARDTIHGFPEIVRLSGSTKGSKFVRLRDFARFLDTELRPVSLPVSQD